MGEAKTTPLMASAYSRSPILAALFSVLVATFWVPYFIAEELENSLNDVNLVDVQQHLIAVPCSSVMDHGSSGGEWHCIVQLSRGRGGVETVRHSWGCDECSVGSYG